MHSDHLSPEDLLRWNRITASMKEMIGKKDWEGAISKYEELIKRSLPIGKTQKSEYLRSLLELNRIGEAEQTFQEMPDPNHVVFNMMMLSYLQNKQFNKMEDLFQDYMVAVKEGRTQLRPDVLTTRIKQYGARQDAKGLMEFTQIMNEMPIQPDAEMLATLCSSFIATNQPNFALDMIRQVNQDELKDVLLDRSIFACVNYKQPVSAFVNLARSHRPSTLVGSRLIWAAIHLDELNDAARTFATYHQHGVDIDQTILGSLCFALRKKTSTWWAMPEIYRAIHYPSIVTSNAYIVACIANQQYQAVTPVLREISPNLQASTLNVLIQAFALSPYLPEFLKFAKERNFNFEPFAVLACISAFQRVGILREISLEWMIPTLNKDAHRFSAPVEKLAFELGDCRMWEDVLKILEISEKSNLKMSDEIFNLKLTALSHVNPQQARDMLNSAKFPISWWGWSGLFQLELEQRNFDEISKLWQRCERQSLTKEILEKLLAHFQVENPSVAAEVKEVLIKKRHRVFEKRLEDSVLKEWLEIMKDAKS